MSKRGKRVKAVVFAVFLFILVCAVLYYVVALTGNVSNNLGERCTSDSDVYEANTHCVNPKFKVDAPETICNTSSGNNWGFRANLIAYDHFNFSIANIITDYNGTADIGHNSTGSLTPIQITEGHCSCSACTQ